MSLLIRRQMPFCWLSELESIAHSGGYSEDVPLKPALRENFQALTFHHVLCLGRSQPSHAR